MRPAERAARDRFGAVHAGDLARPHFERWLYATPEAVLGPDAYLALVARNDRGRFAVHDTRRQAERLYAARLYAAHRPGALAANRARRAAREFPDGSRDLWSTCRVLSALWADGHDVWVPRAFAGVDSERDGVPAPEVRARWEPDALARPADRRPAPAQPGRPRARRLRPSRSCGARGMCKPDAVRPCLDGGRSHASGEPIGSSAVDGCRGAPAP